MKKAIYPTLACLGALVLAIGTQESAIAAKLGLFKSQTNVGETPKRGKVKYDSAKDEYAVTGGGENIWGRTDAFEYVYKEVSGDVTLTADISFVGEGTVQHRKGALMIRQSLSPSAAYADVAIHGDGLTSLQYRESPGAETKEIQSDLKRPSRFRIERKGNQFTLYAGNGDDLKPTGPVTVNLQDPVYIGLAVSSHKADVLETLLFSHVKLEQGEGK